MQPSPRGPPDAVGEAPGRVNLIGEHTDYCDGWVLPLPLPLTTRVELWRRSDRQVTARTELGNGQQLKYQLGEERAGRGWLDYVQGATAVLRELGLELSGVDLNLHSTIPAGAGLASSAALGVALLRALRDAFRLPVDDVEVARLAQRAETHFVGAPVGPMDPLAASLGKPGVALLVDTRSRTLEHVPLPEGLEVGVFHSGVAHHNAGGVYAERRREAEAAARALGLSTLRDVEARHLRALSALPPPLDRRARHVVGENARVLAFVEALRRADTARLGPLLEASHRSLRDDYEVSHPDVDRLVELAWALPDVLGARMTGGGCGGAILFLTYANQAARVGGLLLSRYRRATGEPGALLVPAPQRAAQGPWPPAA